MLSAIYVGIATSIHSVIVALAGTLQGTFATSGRRRAVRRALALALVGIAIWFALTTGRAQ
jgi:threonine/homoserine/homoserine lactone efflux protein